MLEDYLEIRPEAGRAFRRWSRPASWRSGPGGSCQTSSLVAGETLVRRLEAGLARARGRQGHDRRLPARRVRARRAGPSCCGGRPCARMRLAGGPGRCRPPRLPLGRARRLDRQDRVSDRRVRERRGAFLLPRRPGPGGHRLLELLDPSSAPTPCWPCTAPTTPLPCPSCSAWSSGSTGTRTGTGCGSGRWPPTSSTGATATTTTCRGGRASCALRQGPTS